MDLMDLFERRVYFCPDCPPGGAWKLQACQIPNHGINTAQPYALALLNGVEAIFQAQ